MKYILISVELEEWFDSKWFDPRSVISRHYDDFPVSDIRTTTRRLLKLFDSRSVTATFFGVLNTCKSYPGIIDDIVKANHEVGLHGNDHKSIRQLGERRFREEVQYAKNELEKLSGQKVIGYRAPNFEVTREALRIIADLGFTYDSSINPCLKIPRWYGWPTCPTRPFKLLFQEDVYMKNGGIIEFPLSVFPFVRLPGSGGWYLRNFGLNWVKLLLKLHLKRQNIAVFYIHPWEISDNNPKFPEIPFHVFRRTGNWTLRALGSIIDTFKNYVAFKSFKEFLENTKGQVGPENGEEKLKLKLDP
jgi:polysaccharide deacetylase family protein (PEP-CTERM system associated)